MKRSDFKKFVDTAVSVGGLMPINLPEKAMDQVIDQGLTYLYRNWNEAFQVQYSIIHPGAFRTDAFRQSRTIQMPDCVIGIKMLREIKDGGRLFGINDPMLNMGMLATSSILMAPWSSDTLSYINTQMSFWDLCKSFTLQDIQFKYNANTNTVNILGHDPIRPVLIQAMTKIPEEDMFEDPIVQKYIIGKAKLQLARSLSLFNYTLVGGVTINAESIKSEATEDIQQVEDKLKSDNACLGFVMFQ